jgi:hypothetical protein
MPTIKLQQVKNFDKLLKYLESELGWPVEGREIDDIAFPFDLEADLGLDKNEVAKVRHVYRLKKMHKKQPFGIFFVDFEGKKMPVSVLKRILRNLALKRKANAKAADQLAWDVEDLIFISAVGEEKDSAREISFAHFRKEPDNRHVLKIMAWDGGDTPLKMDHLDDVLHEFLRFPDDTNDVDAWRKSWTAAFRTGLRQNIRRSEELAKALAALAMRINKEALSLIKKESANGPLKTLHAGFKDALIHDLTEEAFTDCYAQTITYGLLTAAITKVNQAGVKDLTSTSVLEMVPSTNPFLKDILSSFLEAGGRGQKGIDFDDLGVQDVIDLLRAESTDLPNILRDFGNLTQDEDPVIHFYETFLKIYNKDERVKRGAFYTPRPVVSYIVRSVDELLRKEFGLEDGLADTTTWGEMIKRDNAIKLPPLTDNPGEKKTIKETEPFVQILDPATGTATFLVEVINIIEKTVKAKAWAKLKNGPYDHDQHSKRDEVLKVWNEYVPEHLLKRLHAYELMMAPYVIAHMKVGLKLAETGYRFATEERARIYLTNSLEPAADFKERLNFDIPALAIEAKEVNSIKRNKRFTVVIGNPPYSNFGQLNKNEFIHGLLEAYKQGLDEKKINLDDDFIKFVRFSQYIVDVAGVGIVGMITNNVFLDGLTHRRMRESLKESFKYISIIDLHGSSKKLEVGPDGSKEENVFEIQQGVGISLLSKSTKISEPIVIHSEVWGSREKKYMFLSNPDVEENKSEIIASEPPHFFFVPKSFEGLEEYLEQPSIAGGVFIERNAGIQTKRDSLVYSFTKEELEGKIEDLRSVAKSILISKYELPEDGRDWSIEWAKKDVKKSDGKAVRVAYHPFDLRWTYFTGRSKGFMAYPRTPLMWSMLQPNISMLAVRNSRRGNVDSFFIGNRIIDKDAVSPFDNASFFPLYLYSAPADSQGTLDLNVGRSLNLSPDFLRTLCGKLGLAQKLPNGLPEGLIPEDILYYAYSVFFSPTYRSRYAEYLKIDFPRLPIVSELKLFQSLSKLGGELAAMHLLESPKVHVPIAEYRGGRSRDVEKVSWSQNAVWLDKEQTAGFHGVREDIWNFKIGGYQVCEKWLKDRKGRTLAAADVEHYQKILASIAETIRLMNEIDEVINSYGGWPKAFQ